MPGSSPSIIFTAAHGGFTGMGLPLGGGAAVADRLVTEWARSRRWPVTMIGAGPHSPCPGIHYEQATGVADKVLTRLTEREYAAFCRRFSAASTDRLLSLKSGSATPGAALVNDIAEGPDFARLSRNGIPTAAIFHVDVVDYFCRIYLNGWIAPHRITRWYDSLCRHGWESKTPPMLRLVFGQQRDAVQHAKALIVPSQGMAAVLNRCYPNQAPGKVRVIPWGCWQEEVNPAAVDESRARIRAAVGSSRPPVLLTLSRISPEKGLDTLIEALIWRERRSHPPVTLLMAGDAAYMRGQSFMKRIQSRAALLRRSRVYFPGHAGPAEKAALFSLADLYVFPSRHESYGLTLCEALAAGLPAITTDHYSATDLISPDNGWIVPRNDPPALGQAITDAFDDHGVIRKRPAPRPRPFSTAASAVADLLDDLWLQR